MKNYEPRIGNDFPVRISEKTRHVTELTRSAIAIAVLCLSSVALVGAAVVGAFTEQFGPLQTVWAIVAAPLGWILGHYFRGNGTNDDESAT
jgi:hypothetical protein